MSYSVKDGGARFWVCAAAALLGCSAGDETSSRGGDLGVPSGTAGRGTAAAKTSAAIPGGNVATNTAIPGAVDAGHVATTPLQPGTTKGTFKPPAQLDPSVQFDWQETAASSSNDQCMPGTYTGMFDCGFLPDGATPADTMPFDVTGPLSITLQRSMDGEFLEISDGDLTAAAQGIFGMRAKLVGKLDCKTLQLTAMATDGMWALGDPNMPLIPGGSFAGMLTGTLDPQKGSLSGDWALDSGAGANATIPGTCPGTWTTMYMP